MEFKTFAAAVNTAFKTLVAADKGDKNLFVVDVSGDELYEAYQNAFPEGSNPVFRERRDHDCSTCRQFVKNIGGVVAITGDKLVSIWDVKLDDDVYAVVAARMSAFVKSKAIKAPFFVTEPQYGSATTVSGGEIWNHFEAVVPRYYILKHNTPNVVGERRTDFEVFTRSMETISAEAIDVVSELIDQNSIYMGQSFKATVDALKKHRRAYFAVAEDRRALYAWQVAKPQTRYRNTVIGTLLVDISEGVDLESAVAKYEAKTAPTNYKRSTALVTDRMIADAKKTVEQLGIEDAFHRRYACREDIAVNNVLFVDGAVRPAMIGGVFDGVKATKKSKAPEFGKTEKIGVADFIEKVLPRAESVEVFVKSELANSFVSLIAPVHADAPPLFKWDNGFSWSYAGELTDGIKERVKKAGGKVDGDVRVSLSWYNGDDLDLSVRWGHQTVYFGTRRAFGATLDVDMNAGGATNSKDPVENIYWNRVADMPNGRFNIVVHNFRKRSNSNLGFVVEVEVCGKLWSKAVDAIEDRAYVEIGSIVVNNGVVEVVGLTPGGVAGEKWGVATESWVPVDMIMRSPNYWDGQAIGNEHVFFMLKGCVNPDDTRGFYNEFLRSDLNAHRKVFEVLGGTLKARYTENQLSGIGVSVTRKEELVVRVKGAVNRVLNVIF